MKLVLLLDDGAERRSLIDENIIATTVGLAEEQQRRLVDAVDQSIGGNVILGAGQAAELVSFYFAFGFIHAAIPFTKALVSGRRFSMPP